MSDPRFAPVLAAIADYSKSATDLASLQEFIVETIPARLPWYNWTGFYMLDPENADMLVLGPFRGAATEHTRIPVNEGICGAAVAQNDTVIVDDVNADPRYLACSIETKSEIVVPIRVHEKVVGEIDIDSHDLAAFSANDKAFLEACASIVGTFMEKLPTYSASK
jgi:L-methionine (R)-S-oxide reductase